MSRGDHVAATLRRPEQFDDLAGKHGDRLWRRRLDVTDTAQIEDVMAQAFADHERIDVVVSNAGLGVFGAAEDLTYEQGEGTVATNLTGSTQLARRAVPHLRAQGGGRVRPTAERGRLFRYQGGARGARDGADELLRRGCAGSAQRAVPWRPGGCSSVPSRGHGRQPVRSRPRHDRNVGCPTTRRCACCGTPTPTRPPPPRYAASSRRWNGSVTPPTPRA
ncbi:SDR family NAD(P)-dependent oxidoreductase [Streptomyces chrestomyceticus]|uniref:SDR family NAD(P)-dependent oxidoreductase n=1 Tax=Streptomyces chrestomyceticus TaxID=68185 RepID=UPI003699A2E2